MLLDIIFPLLILAGVIYVFAQLIVVLQARALTKRFDRLTSQPIEELIKTGRKLQIIRETETGERAFDLSLLFKERLGFPSVLMCTSADFIGSLFHYYNSGDDRVLIAKEVVRYVPATQLKMFVDWVGWRHHESEVLRSLIDEVSK